ncbi:MAG: sialate O-acetylesterase [Acidovorax sp.]
MRNASVGFFRQLSILQMGRVVCLLGLAWMGANSNAQPCCDHKARKHGSTQRVRKLFVIAGQSNAVGLASVRDIPGGANDYVQENTVFPNVKIYGIYGAAPGVKGHDDAVLSKKVNWSRFATWHTARPGFGYKNVANAPQYFPSGSRAEDMFGPELSLARSLNERPPYEFYIVKLAVSNTTLNYTPRADNWAPGGHLYKELMEMVRHACRTRMGRKKIRVAGLFFMQGESDALNKVWARNYERNLSKFIQAFRRDVVGMGCAESRKTPVVLGEIQDNPVWTYRKTVRRAQRQVVRALPYVKLVSTDRLAGQMTAGGTHFNEYGQTYLGESVYEAFFPMHRPFKRQDERQLQAMQVDKDK